MVSKPLTIAGIAFPTMGAAVAHARVILYRDQPGTEITGADAEFVEALLCARADKLLDLQGLNVSRYLRDWQDGPVKRTICFWAELEEGTLVDFSFMTAIKVLAGAGEAAEPST